MPSEIERFERTSVELYSQVRDGVPVSDTLIEHYLPRLRAFVRAHVGEQLRSRESDSDVVQSVCRDLLGDRDRLDFGTEGQFRSWLFTAALNKIRTKARRWGRERRSSENEVAPGSEGDFDQLFEGYSGVATPSRIASVREQVERIENAMEQLTDEHREVIALRRVARLSYAEVARRMDRGVDAVRGLLGRALRNLAATLEAGAQERKDLMGGDGPS